MREAARRQRGKARRGGAWRGQWAADSAGASCCVCMRAARWGNAHVAASLTLPSHRRGCCATAAAELEEGEEGEEEDGEEMEEDDEGGAPAEDDDDPYDDSEL